MYIHVVRVHLHVPVVVYTWWREGALACAQTRGGGRIHAHVPSLLSAQCSGLSAHTPHSSHSPLLALVPPHTPHSSLFSLTPHSSLLTLLTLLTHLNPHSPPHSSLLTHPSPSTLRPTPHSCPPDRIPTRPVPFVSRAARQHFPQIARGHPRRSNRSGVRRACAQRRSGVRTADALQQRRLEKVG